ncbi:sensor histidine kinase [Desulfobacula sp.]|uniref:sensor histidine kinase n=2 Tax=Desulfobacula sp. TaxID=2593537 RepID=UPI0039B9A5B4
MMDKKKINHTEKGETVKRSILTNMIIIPFIPFVLAIGVSYYFFTTAIEYNTTNSLRRIVGDHRDMIESFLMERKSDLELITNTFGFEKINQKNSIDTIFGNLKNRSGAFIDLGLFDSKGVLVRYSGKYQLKGKKYKDELWFKQVMLNGTYISDIFLGYRNVPHFVIAVKQGSGDKTWALRATIDTLFFDRLVSKVRIGRTGESYILNKKGISQTKRRSGGFRVMDQDSEYSDFPSLGDGIQTFIKSNPLKYTYLYATAWLKNGDWLLVVRQEKQDAYKSLYSAIYISLIIMIIGGAVIVIMAIYITERIAKKIEHLGQEKKSLGHQLIRATQLAEIGEMAAGFAHEINNPLQIIKSEHALIKILLEDIADKSGAQKDEDMIEIMDSLDQIKLQVNRCAQITHDILKFGRKNETKHQVLNPCHVIPEIVHMIEKKAWVSGIKIIKQFSENSFAFMGDPSQFQQVMLNLFNNAMDAIGDRHGVSGGILTIESYKKEDNFLEIKITDNGTGIRPENLEKIFSPFFTTKPVGKGTGLGLCVCFGIIENFGGTMEVISELNAGTTFVIRLPAVN